MTLRLHTKHWFVGLFVDPIREYQTNLHGYRHCFSSLLHLTDTPPEIEGNPGLHPGDFFSFNFEGETYAFVDNELFSTAAGLAALVCFPGFRTYRVGCHRRVCTRLGVGESISFSWGVPSLADPTNASFTPFFGRISCDNSQTTRRNKTHAKSPGTYKGHAWGIVSTGTISFLLEIRLLSRAGRCL